MQGNAQYASQECQYLLGGKFFWEQQGSLVWGFDNLWGLHQVGVWCTTWCTVNRVGAKQLGFPLVAVALHHPCTRKLCTRKLHSLSAPENYTRKPHRPFVPENLDTETRCTSCNNCVKLDSTQNVMLQCYICIFTVTSAHFSVDGLQYTIQTDLQCTLLVHSVLKHSTLSSAQRLMSSAQCSRVPSWA